MNKTIVQGIILIFSFFSTWFLLQEVNWMSLFQVKQSTEKLEQKLGELCLDVFKAADQENDNPFLINTIDSIVTRICSENKIERDKIKVHVINKDDVNAFALPDGHLVIYTGLISASANPEELSGVISHEIAHIELNHVMEKLLKEVGLSVLVSMTTGNNNPEIIKETAKTLSSSAFDRNIEKEADIQAVDYLIKANINPKPFANFLYKLSLREGEASKYLSWISTHPNSKERAEYIIERCKNRTLKNKSIVAAKTWEKFLDEAQSVK